MFRPSPYIGRDLHIDRDLPFKALRIVKGISFSGN
jgi:hypothetical protein